MSKIALVVMAAGEGKRLKIDIAKSLIPLHNKKLVDYVIDSLKDFGDIYIVTGHQREKVESYIAQNHNDLNISFIQQDEQLGTGNAVQSYFEKNEKSKDYEYTLVTCVDMPLVTSEIINELIDEIKNEIVEKSNAICASFIHDHPKGYGRVIRSEKGIKIVEEKDATDKEKKIIELNSGLYIFKTHYLEKHISNLKNNNNAKEFYLTDVFNFGEDVKSHLFEDSLVFLGINNLMQLSDVERILRSRIINDLLLNVGVKFLDPRHTYVYSRNIGKGTSIAPNVTIDASSVIGEDVVIEQGCMIENSIIEDGVYIKANSYIVDSKVKKNAKIGPMAHLRPRSIIGKSAKIGNFVEIKKSVIGDNTNVSHLSYVGDAEIGNDVNIGCGFITCNYDGSSKYKTIIGDGSFVGSDSQMVAPITIGKKCYIASGSTITEDMNDGSFGISRCSLKIHEEMASKFMQKKDSL